MGVAPATLQAECHFGNPHTGVLMLNQVKLQIIFRNKATSDYSFVSLSPIFTIFSIVVHNHIVSHLT